MDTVRRKLEKIKREGERRSPRISALDAWKMAQRSRRVGFTLPSTQKMEGNFHGPASRTRARKKRKLRPVEEVVCFFDFYPFFLAFLFCKTLFSQCNVLWIMCGVLYAFPVPFIVSHF